MAWIYCETGHLSRTARILGAGQTAYVRRPDETLTTKDVLARAAALALEDAGLAARDVDGLGVASFSLTPDRGIDLGVQLGLHLRWLMDGGTGGASAVDMLQHARRAIESGDARCILLVAGDVLPASGQRSLTNAYNAARQAYLAPYRTVARTRSSRSLRACTCSGTASHGRTTERLWSRSASGQGRTRMRSTAIR